MRKINQQALVNHTVCVRNKTSKKFKNKFNELIITVVLPVAHIWPLGFLCGGMPVCNSLPDNQRDPTAGRDNFRHSLNAFLSATY